MSPDQFQDLYKRLRGNRAALVVFDARTLFVEKKLKQSYDKLLEARDVFTDSRSRVLRQAPEQHLDPKARDAKGQLKKLKRRQDKTLEALELFDEMIPQLEKLVERQQRRLALQESSQEESNEQASEKPLVNDPSSSTAETDDSTVKAVKQVATQRVAGIKDLTDALTTALSDASNDQRLDLINQYFGFRKVKSESDLHGESLYYVKTSKEGILVGTPAEDQMKESVQLTNVLDRRTIKPFSRKAFVKLGVDRKMVLLTCPIDGVRPDELSGDVTDQATYLTGASIAGSPERNRGGAAVNSDIPESQDAPASQDADTANDEANVLDLGAFSQLLTSAQRSGLVPDADQVGYVRDREFRMGKYDLAFQTIDMMYSRFMSSAGQRLQRLAREDADIASGRIQISPKDLQAKRARDRNQTQEVERAKRRFQVVLEGLRVLMNTGLN